jgi:hypothetical protein
MSVKNVKVAFIRKEEYDNLKEWMEDEDNVYIGRKGVVFIADENGKQRFPKENSPFHNPFKIDKDNTREDVLKKYKIYIKDKLKDKNFRKMLYSLKGKNLGCWCCPEKCHGDILLELINQNEK